MWIRTLFIDSYVTAKYHKEDCTVELTSTKTPVTANAIPQSPNRCTKSQGTSFLSYCVEDF